VITITTPSPGELIELHQLNYKTFVEEIPQHPANDSRILVDRFNDVSKWLVAKKENKICGMVCYNLNRPFSLDAKVANLDRYLPPHENLAEVRLLAIEKPERRKLITYRLLKKLCAELISLHVDAVVISGTTRQLPLYRKMGFEAFGQLTGKKEALFQPMYITVNLLRNDFKRN
jgi:hypothetical protein